MVAHSWQDDPLAKRWAPAIEGHRHDTFPDGAAYELQALHVQWKEAYVGHDGTLCTPTGTPVDATLQATLCQVLRGEVTRILSRKEARSATAAIKAKQIAEIDGRLARASGLKDTLSELRSIVDEIIVARRIAPLLADDRSAAVSAWNDCAPSEELLLKPRTRGRTTSTATPQEEVAA
jgi:hypothetical protein